MATFENRKKAAQMRRKKRIRKKVHGTGERPRLVVTRSLKHIRVSLVDDERGVTLLGLMDSSLKEHPAAEVVVESADAKGEDLSLIHI